jgi:hypothetical protein
MPIGYLAKGTIENIFVDIVDRSVAPITDLSTSNPTFDVIDFADVFKETAASASASGMRITVPLDTTDGGVWAVGEYRMFVSFTVGSQQIRKGPFYFTLTET